MDNKKKTKIEFIKKSPSSEYGAYRVGDFGYIDGYTQGCAVIILENGKFATAELNWIKVVNNEDKNLSLELEGDKSSEDDEIRKMLILIVNITPAAVAVKNREKLLAWLEKQGGQKFALSKADEEYMEDVIAFLKDASVCNPNAIDCINWLKYLCSKCYWKPSKEQKDAIEKVLKYFKMLNAYGETIDILNSLLNDFKKLTE